MFSPLRRAKLIRSVRGAQGGYFLNKSPKDITVAEIMEILEGPIEISECVDGVPCTNVDCCATRLLWKKIKDSIDDVMQSVTLQDIIDDYNRLNTKNSTINLKTEVK